MTKSGLRRLTCSTNWASLPGACPPVRSDIITKRKASGELGERPFQPAGRLRPWGCSGAQPQKHDKIEASTKTVNILRMVIVNLLDWRHLRIIVGYLEDSIAPPASGKLVSVRRKRRVPPIYTRIRASVTLPWTRRPLALRGRCGMFSSVQQFHQIPGTTVREDIYSGPGESALTLPLTMHNKRQRRCVRHWADRDLVENLG